MISLTFSYQTARRWPWGAGATYAPREYALRNLHPQYGWYARSLLHTTSLVMGT
jgi:hypothetical protein